MVCRRTYIRNERQRVDSYHLALIYLPLFYCAMLLKYKISTLFSVFILFFSCNSSAGYTEEEIIKDYSVFYSIAVKSALGEDLLDAGTPDAFGRYFPSDIKILSPPQKNVKEQRHLLRTFDSEWRIVVNVDLDDKAWNNYFETILELRVLHPWVSSDGNYSHDGIFSNDTIRCGIVKEKNKVIFTYIRVNGLLLWEKNNLNEEPFIEFEKEYARGPTFGL